MPSKKTRSASTEPSAPAIAPLAPASASAPLATAGAAVNYRDSWRIFRIMAEMVEGYQFLGKFNKEVVILGSARIPPNNKYYKIAEELGHLLGKNGFATLTGGGPGIMEAANKGAFERGGVSVGINMRLDGKERLNSYLTRSIGFFFPYIRKLIITAPSKAFVFFPGGFGTLHQLFELLTLIETKKMEPVPIILYGRLFWQPFLEFVHKLHADFNTISHLEEGIITVIDRPEEVLAHIQ